MSTNVAAVPAPAPEAPPAGSGKLKRFGKVLLDNGPIVIGLCSGFVTSPTGIYVIVWITCVISLIAIIVDYVHCRHRWQAGLEAVFPKLFTIVYCLMNAGILVLLYTNLLEPVTIDTWSGLINGTALFVASLISLLIGKPFTYAFAVEFLPPEQLQRVRSTPVGMEIFKEINHAVTIVWTVTFFLLTILSAACAVWRHYGGDKSVPGIVNTVGGIVVVIATARHIQPRVIESTREKARERLLPNGAVQEEQGQQA
jgi:hypothetical protein